MCYSVYLSTTSLEDFSALNSELYHLAAPAADDDPAIVNCLSYPARWYLESQHGGCSCSFRHLCEGSDMVFAPPQDWCPEDADDIEATKEFYDHLSRLVAEGHKVDLLDAWTNAKPEDLTVIDVSLSAVDRDSFRFFENYKFNIST